MAKVYWTLLHHIEDMTDEEKDEFWAAEEGRFRKWWEGTSLYEKSQVTMFGVKVQDKNSLRKWKTRLLAKWRSVIKSELKERGHN